MTTVLDYIAHYQKNIERCVGDEKRILRCIDKLDKLPVTVQHLQETGVGRTVNALRKDHGDVGKAAKALVAKWKNMVAEEEDEETEQPQEDNDTAGEYEREDEVDEDEVELISHSTQDVSRSDSDRKRKHDEKPIDHSKRSRTESHESSGHRKHCSDSEKTQNSYDSDGHAEKKSRNKTEDNDDSDMENKYTNYKHEKTKQNGNDSTKSKSSHHHSSKEKKDHKRESRDSDKKHKVPDEKSHRSDGKHRESSKSSGSSSKSKEKESKHSKDEKKSSESKHAPKTDGKERKESSSSSRDSSRTKSTDSREPSSKKSSSKSDSSKKERSSSTNDDGIGFESGASFAEALGMVIPSPVKKKPTSRDLPSKPSNDLKKVDIKSPSDRKESRMDAAVPSSSSKPLDSLLNPDFKLPTLPPLEISALPEISPNYKPRPPPKLLNTMYTDEEAFTVMLNKNQRTKVYSGNKVYGAVPSLYEMCVNILQENIDALEYTGGVPYDILKPVVDRATPDQLFMLEHYNPYLMDDTDPLWQKHCERKFRSQKRQEMETWREMYMRCLDEQEAKLKSLTANIKLSQDLKKAPTRVTKMAYVDSAVKPPRGIARKQAIYGTAKTPVVSPAARVASLASGNNVVKAVDVKSTSSSSSSSESSAPRSTGGFIKPKKAPLMQKALQFMKGRLKR